MYIYFNTNNNNIYKYIENTKHIYITGFFIQRLAFEK